MGLSVLSTALFAGATGVPQYFARKNAAEDAQEKQEEANQVRQASSSVERARRRRRAIAQTRIAQARNVSGQSQAVQSSSGLAGVQSGLTTQTGVNIGNASAQANTQQSIFNLNQSAQQDLERGERIAGGFDVAGNIGKQIASFGLSNGAFAGTFGANTTSNASVPPNIRRPNSQTGFLNR